MSEKQNVMREHSDEMKKHLDRASIFLNYIYRAERKVTLSDMYRVIGVLQEDEHLPFCEDGYWDENGFHYYTECSSI